MATDVEERWHGLELESLSEYVTSVMRYDQLLGGKPHFANRVARRNV